MTWALVIEELGRVDSSVAVTLSVTSGLGGRHDRAARDRRSRSERWLPRVAAGEILGSFGLTEPCGGSDVRALRTTARLADGAWTIDGSKSFITNSGTPISGFVVVACRTDDGAARRLDAARARRTARASWSARRTGRWAGARATRTRSRSRGAACRRITSSASAATGSRQCLASLDDGRIAIAAMSVGLAQACLDASLAYAGERAAFGRPIGAYEAVAFPMADMQVGDRRRRGCSRTARRG